MAAVLTPLQLTALSGLLQNQGITDSELSSAVTAYTTSTVISPLITTVATGATGNVLTATTLTALKQLAAATCPALSDSVPQANAASYPREFLTTILTRTADKYLGSGDVGKFSQILSASTSYCSSTNQVINSAVNSQTYLGNTFTNMDNMMSGGITAVNPCTQVWAKDLDKLGGLINFANLDEYGTPIAVVKQLAALGGITPQLALAFESSGVSSVVVVNLTSPNLTATDSEQHAMYTAMTKITGSALTQILSILGVTTANITNMADLLNPVKIFPNSFQTLAVTGVNKLSQNIYINAQGTLNPRVEPALPCDSTAELTLSRLKQIIPPDLAVANRALAVSFQGITNIGNLSLRALAKAAAQVQTTQGLPLIAAQTSAVSSNAVSALLSSVGQGTGQNGTIQLNDLLGTAVGYISAPALNQAVSTFATMTLTDLTQAYNTMANTVAGVYGDPVAGPVDIPSGPAAGTYTSAEQAFQGSSEGTGAGLIPTTQSIINTIVAANPTQVAALNGSWANVMSQLTLESTTQTQADIEFDQYTANSVSSVYSLVYSLPDYGRDTQIGGTAAFMQGVADINTLTGQAIIAVMRQGQTDLEASGIGSTSQIPDGANPPIPPAPLLPAQPPYPAP